VELRATLSPGAVVYPASLGVIGLGAIGGSLAWQARIAGVPRVIGYSLRRADGIQALKSSAITELADGPDAVARAAELVVLAVPPQATLELVASLASAVRGRAVLTDVCSVKSPIIRQARASGLGDSFAGGHPLAGTHETGFGSARPDRFRGCVVYICESGDPEGHRAAGRVVSLWEDVLEASPIRIEAEAHDRQLAWTSHLPQVVAYALAKALSDKGLAGVSFGSGARDSMRLAGSSPELWVEVLRHNAAAVGDALEGMEQSLAELRRLLADGDEAGLQRFLHAARAFRQAIGR
jgi:prephenate dehydrogenase